MIDLEKLKKWVIELKPESILNTDSTWYDILLLRQLNIAAVIIGIIKFSIGCESRVTKV